MLAEWTPKNIIFFTHHIIYYRLQGTDKGWIMVIIVLIWRVSTWVSIQWFLTMQLVEPLFKTRRYAKGPLRGPFFRPRNCGTFYFNVLLCRRDPWITGKICRKLLGTTTSRYMTSGWSPFLLQLTKMYNIIATIPILCKAVWKMSSFGRGPTYQNETSYNNRMAVLWPTVYFFTRN